MFSKCLWMRGKTGINFRDVLDHIINRPIIGVRGQFTRGSIVCCGTRYKIESTTFLVQNVQYTHRCWISIVFKTETHALDSLQPLTWNILNWYTSETFTPQFFWKLSTITLNFLMKINCSLMTQRKHISIIHLQYFFGGVGGGSNKKTHLQPSHRRSTSGSSAERRPPLSGTGSLGSLSTTSASALCWWRFYSHTPPFLGALQWQRWTMYK